MTEYVRRDDGVCCRCLKMVAISQDGRFCIRCERKAGSDNAVDTGCVADIPDEPAGYCKVLDLGPLVEQPEVVETATDIAAPVDVPPSTTMDDIPENDTDDTDDEPDLPGASRLEQLRNWLNQVGPQSRQDVINNCPMPDNTIKALLSRTNGFNKDEVGLWSVSVQSASESTVDA